MSEEQPDEAPTSRPEESWRVHPSPLASAPDAGAALAQTLADALDAAGAKDIRRELGIPANARFTDRQIIEHALTDKDPTLRSYYARLAVRDYLRQFARLGLIPEALLAYAVHGLDNLNAGHVVGFAKPAPIRQRKHKGDTDYWRGQLALFVASTIAYLRGRHVISARRAILCLRGDVPYPPDAAWQPSAPGIVREAQNYGLLDKEGRRDPAHHEKITGALMAGESERLGHGPMPEVLAGLQVLEAALRQKRMW